MTKKVQMRESIVNHLGLYQIKGCSNAFLEFPKVVMAIVSNGSCIHKRVVH